MLLSAILALLCACATSPPVQEMSDARQAIAAAEEADAGRYAPQSLQDARRFLEEAEQLLRQEAYGAARINAVRAKNRAAQALAASQAATDARPD
jgi:predicted S18 family serine protease